MYNGNTVSLKSILWTVMNNPVAADLSFDQAAEWSIEAIKLIGAPFNYINKVTEPPLEIINHKVALPANMINIRGIRYIWDLDNYDTQSAALTYAQDVYHYAEDCNTELAGQKCSEFTYTMQEGVIQTSVPDGHLQISYKALPSDDEGYPLIADNQKVKKAVEYYILFRYLEALWTMGKITDKVFDYYVREKSFYMGAANTSMQLAGNDHLEAIGNSINRMIINTNAHRDFFKGTGQKESFKRFN